MQNRIIGQEMPTLAEPAKLGEVILALRYYDGLIEKEEAKRAAGAAHTWLDETRHERGEWARILDAARHDLLAVLEPPVQVANLVAGMSYTRRRIRQVASALENPALTAHQKAALTKQAVTLQKELAAWESAYIAQIPPAPKKRRRIEKAIKAAEVAA